LINALIGFIPEGRAEQAALLSKRAAASPPI